MKDFKGKQRHSTDHPGGEDWSGKKCVVIGSNNSAHDICADLWEYGADVTMVQRVLDPCLALGNPDGALDLSALGRAGAGEWHHPATRPT